MHGESAPAAAGQADESIACDHDVVEYGDAAQLANLSESGGQFHILARRRWIPRRVVMAEDDRGRAAADEGAEHVARVDIDPGERPAGHAGFE